MGVLSSQRHRARLAYPSREGNSPAVPSPAQCPRQEYKRTQRPSDELDRTPCEANCRNRPCAALRDVQRRQGTRGKKPDEIEILLFASTKPAWAHNAPTTISKRRHSRCRSTRAMRGEEEREGGKSLTEKSLARHA
eukprot:176344-Chlamydomonas_euryale.AAC.5